MLRVVFVSFLLVISLQGRENPFFPAKNEVDIPLSTNQVIQSVPLKRAALTLPSTARTIESITITYKNLDGSILTKKESLGNSIDWHLPIFVSQNIGGSADKQVLKSAKRVHKREEHFTKIAGVSFISLYESKNRLKLVTKDKMIRNFLLTQPHRIVCDFKRDIDIRSYEKSMQTDKSIVKKVKLGNHKGYYRVVIELDGHYKYNETARKGAYVITLL